MVTIHRVLAKAHHNQVLKISSKMKNLRSKRKKDTLGGEELKEESIDHLQKLCSAKESVFSETK